MGSLKIGDMVTVRGIVGEITDHIDFFGVVDHYRVISDHGNGEYKIYIFHSSELTKISPKHAAKLKKLRG